MILLVGPAGTAMIVCSASRLCAKAKTGRRSRCGFCVAPHLLDYVFEVRGVVADPGEVLVDHVDEHPGLVNECLQACPDFRDGVFGHPALVQVEVVLRGNVFDVAQERSKLKDSLPGEGDPGDVYGPGVVPGWDRLRWGPCFPCPECFRVVPVLLCATERPARVVEPLVPVTVSGERLTAVVAGPHERRAFAADATRDLPTVRPAVVASQPPLLLRGRWSRGRLPFTRAHGTRCSLLRIALILVARDECEPGLMTIKNGVTRLPGRDRRCP